MVQRPFYTCASTCQAKLVDMRKKVCSNADMTPKQLVAHYGNKRQAALRIGVSRRTIYNWLAAGRIPPRTLPWVLERVGK